MHTIIFSCLLSILLPTTIPGPDLSDPPASLATILSKTTFEKAFPHRNAIYTYEALIKAAARFPTFANTGDLTTRKRELAAFLAHIAHETSNGGPGSEGGPYSWGLFYTEERGCQDGHCTQYNTAGTSSYKPVAGKTYYGRGPLQLSYTYNYGLAGEELKLPILAQPELVAKDGTIAFTTALWFWMRAQKPKPSCHEVMTGVWQPTADDIRLNRKPGFGMTINLINGAVECSKDTPEALALREERIGSYKHFAAILHIAPDNTCDCKGMGVYGN